jgi:hypothetical protein
MKKSVYRVSFFKTLQDGAGHPRECCQGEVEVHASGDPEAVVIARRRFAELAHVGDWSLRADHHKVECLPGRKRASHLLLWPSKQGVTHAPASAEPRHSERVIPAALSPDSSLGLVESANLRFPTGREFRKGMWRHGQGD